MLKKDTFERLGITGFKAIKTPGAGWVYMIQYVDGRVEVRKDAEITRRYN